MSQRVCLWLGGCLLVGWVACPGRLAADEPRPAGRDWKLLASHLFERPRSGSRPREFYSITLASVATDKTFERTGGRRGAMRTVMLYQGGPPGLDAATPAKVIWAATLPQVVAASARHWDLVYYPESDRLLVVLQYYDSEVREVYGAPSESDPKSPSVSLRVWPVDPTATRQTKEVLENETGGLDDLGSSPFHFAYQYRLPKPFGPKTYLVGIREVKAIPKGGDLDVFLLREDVSDPVQVRLNLATKTGAVVQEPRTSDK